MDSGIAWDAVVLFQDSKWQYVNVTGYFGIFQQELIVLTWMNFIPSSDE